MKIPSVCLCDEEQAFEVMAEYISAPASSAKREWIDIYELIPYSTS